MVIKAQTIPTLSKAPVAAAVCLFLLVLSVLFPVNYVIEDNNVLLYSIYLTFWDGLHIGIALLMGLFCLIAAKRKTYLICLPVVLMTLFQIIYRFTNASLFRQRGVLMIEVIVQNIFYISVATLFILTIFSSFLYKSLLNKVCFGIVGIEIMMILINFFLLFLEGPTRIYDHANFQPIYLFHYLQCILYFLSVGILAYSFRSGPDPSDRPKRPLIPITFASLYLWFSLINLSFSKVEIRFGIESNTIGDIYFKHWVGLIPSFLSTAAGVLLIWMLVKLPKEKAWSTVIPLSIITSFQFIIPFTAYRSLIAFRFDENYFAFCFLIVLIVFILTISKIFKNRIPLTVTCLLVMAVALTLKVINILQTDWSPHTMHVDGLYHSGVMTLFSHVNLSRIFGVICFILFILSWTNSLYAKPLKTDKEDTQWVKSAFPPNQ